MRGSKKKSSAWVNTYGGDGNFPKGIVLPKKIADLKEKYFGKTLGQRALTKSKQ